MEYLNHNFVLIFKQLLYVIVPIWCALVVSQVSLVEP